MGETVCTGRKTHELLWVEEARGGMGVVDKKRLREEEKLQGMGGVTWPHLIRSYYCICLYKTKGTFLTLEASRSIG